MMITCHTVRWKNLLATGNDFTEVRLDDGGITLVVGENGAGKSTLLDAIAFVWFGRAFRNINKPQLVNSINGKDCVAEIEMTVGETKYLVRRGIKPNIFEVYRDGQSLMEELVNVTDQQAWFELNVLNGMNFKTFSQIVVLSATNYTSFLNLPATARRMFVEDVLQLRVFTVMNMIAKKRSAALIDKLRVNQYQMDITENSVKGFQTIASQAQQNVDSIIKLKASQIKEIQTQLESFVASMSSIEEQLGSTDFDANKLSKLIQQQTELQQALSKVQLKHRLNCTHKKFLTDNTICPTCKQQIEEESRNQQLTQADTDNTALENMMASVQASIDSLQLRISALQSAETLITNLKRQKDTTEKEINSCNKRIKEIEKETVTLIKRQSTANDKMLVKFQDELKELSAVREDLLQQQRLLETNLQLLKDDGIKAQIIKHYIPTINGYVNKYLNILEFDIGFDFTEQFDEVIKARHRDDFSYSSFSQGEKSRIDLALLFAWREVASLRNSIKTNLLIMDEVLDSSMDTIGIELLFDMLSQIESSIIIISHREVFIDKVPNYIKFEKQGHFSRIADKT